MYPGATAAGTGPGVDVARVPGGQLTDAADVVLVVVTGAAGAVVVTVVATGED